MLSSYIDWGRKKNSYKIRCTYGRYNRWSCYSINRVIRNHRKFFGSNMGNYENGDTITWMRFTICTLWCTITTYWSNNYLPQFKEQNNIKEDTRTKRSRKEIKKFVLVHKRELIKSHMLSTIGWCEWIYLA